MKAFLRHHLPRIVHGGVYTAIIMPLVGWFWATKGWQVVDHTVLFSMGYFVALFSAPDRVDLPRVRQKALAATDQMVSVLRCIVDRRPVRTAEALAMLDDQGALLAELGVDISQDASIAGAVKRMEVMG